MTQTRLIHDARRQEPDQHDRLSGERGSRHCWSTTSPSSAGRRSISTGVRSSRTGVLSDRQTWELVVYIESLGEAP